MKKNEDSNVSRRDFLAAGAVATATLSAPFIHANPAQNSDPIKIGLVGCGGRGTGAVADALNADPQVRLVAMADPFRDRIELSLKNLRDPSRRGGPLDVERIAVTEETCFTGLGGYRKLLEMDLDYVCLVAPPGFRPFHFEAAIDSGKHVFAEKPLGTDPVGVRRIRETAQKAKEKGLSVVVGLNYRHSPYNEELIRRVHSGAIGNLISGRAYRMHGGLWHRGSNPSWTPMEYQCRNWYYFCWLSGDQITEMAVHSMDFVNWVMNSPPLNAVGSGGRTLRTDQKYGNIWDHMSIDYEYPNDVHVTLMVRQWDNCVGVSGTFFSGSEGTFDRQRITGKNPYGVAREERKEIPSGQYEHWKLIDSIRNGKMINNVLEFAADSTLTTIMGREAAYTGQRVTWEEMLTSKLDLAPKGGLEFGPAPERPPARPGQPRV